MVPVYIEHLPLLLPEIASATDEYCGSSGGAVCGGLVGEVTPVMEEELSVVLRRGAELSVVLRRGVGLTERLGTRTGAEITCWMPGVRLCDVCVCVCV